MLELLTERIVNSYLTLQKHWVYPMLLFIVLLVKSGAYAANLKLNGVSLQECRSSYCVTVNTTNMTQSSFSNLYAFESADVQVKEFKTSRTIIFKGYSGAYDIKKGLFFLTKGEKEVLIDSINQNIVEF